MAYFNNAFNKVFVGTSGFVNTATTATSALTKGQFAFVDPKTWVVPADVDASSALKCPLVLAAGSIMTHDKIGPFAGGYKESDKSKIINPKYVSRFYRVDPCTPQNNQIYIGLNQDNFADPGSCAKDFKCNETYYLMMQIKGSPVLRTLTRNTYYTADAYTGCCPTGELSPSNVNPLIVYSKWAYNFLRSPLIAPYINIQITYSLDAGTTWLQLAPSAAVGAYAAGDSSDLDALLAYNLDPSTLPGDNTTLAGMIITGAYVDTRFNDCTFYPNDSTIAYVEPVKILASEVDYNGNPCEFTGLCVNTQCEPIQGSGFGETVVRELILSSAYSQSPMNTGMDLRIREITQGYDFTDTIARGSSYYRYYLLHSVPRFNNPTGVFDNDQYLLEIITDQVEAVFEQFVFDWLTNANNGCELDATQNAGAGGPVVYACPTACTTVDPTT